MKISMLVCGRKCRLGRAFRYVAISYLAISTIGEASSLAAMAETFRGSLLALKATHIPAWAAGLTQTYWLMSYITEATEKHRGENQSGTKSIGW